MNNNKKDLEYFKRLKYDIVIRKKKDGFLLSIHELSLLEEDKDIEKAYEKLEYEKDKYFQKMIENGYQEHIGEPKCKKTKNDSSWNPAPFFIKLFAIVLIVVIVLSTKNTISRSLKYFDTVAKAVAQTAEDISQTLNLEDTVFKVTDTLDSIQLAKREKNLFLKYRPLFPLDLYASNSLDNFPIEFAFDSDPNTFWHSSTNNAYLIMKFEFPSRLKALSITSRPDLHGIQGPEKCFIEGSNDNKNWEHIDNISYLKWKKRETKIVSVENRDKYYVYYKFSFTIQEKESYISIVEMGLYH
ncbi:MAG: discoidin domain-containing protein [Candidatus Scalindua sp.]|nr:discoidin domain-containing protein [Candidatus Scalindua sp.]